MLSETELVSLRELIDSHLRRNNVYIDIRKFVHEFGGAESERQVLGEVLAGIDSEPTPSKRKGDGQHLVVHVTGISGDEGLCKTLRVHCGENRFILNRITGSTFCVTGSSNAPMHLVLLSESGELIGSHMFEWRRVLTGHGANVSVDFEGTLSLVGGFTLDLRLDYSGPPVKDIEDVIKRQTASRMEASRQFSHYATKWWSEFIDIHPSFRTRLVKIFVQNEWRQHVNSSSVLSPLRADHLIHSPQMAARWVSLLPYVREETIGGGGRNETWHSFHSIFARNKGDVEDHALLLCSLFLGFGLDAYVAVGTIVEDGVDVPHVWVMTFGSKHAVACWESLTGARHPHNRDRKVHCLFNDRCFYGNKQLDLNNTKFVLKDDSQWKQMDERLLVRNSISNRLVVSPSVLDSTVESNRLENLLRHAITNERMQQYDLDTQWDDDLSFYLSPALSAYESEKCTGVLHGNEDFQYIIKGHIPIGHSFKGYPTMFNHRDTDAMLHSLRGGTIPNDIMKTRADHVYFALRVQVYPYPEGLVSVWVMLAVRFRASEWFGLLKS